MTPDEMISPSEDLVTVMRQIAAGGNASASSLPAPPAQRPRPFTLAELMPTEPDPFDSSSHPGPSLPWPDHPVAAPGSPSVLDAPGGGVSGLERSLLGDLADAGVRRAVEDLAGRNRRAVENGATDASQYEADRVPEFGGEVIYRGFPAQVLKVRDPGRSMSSLDLLQYHTGRPEAFTAVEHDRDHGWHWLGEPPPPDPTGADRVRAAIAAGRPVPKVGDVVHLIRAKPRSYKGIELIALRAKVLAQVDVIGSKIILDLEVLDELVDGLEAATASGIVCGVEGPDEHREGWAASAWASRFQEPDTRSLHLQPCDLCGAKMNHLQAVQFLSRTHNDYHSPTIFAQLCLTCADQFGRLAFKPTEPEPAGPTDHKLAVLA